MIVKIPITPNHDGCPLYVKELEISDFCPICGVKRGEIQHGVHSYDGSRWVGCDGWKNPLFWLRLRRRYFDAIGLLDGAESKAEQFKIAKAFYEEAT